MMSSSSEVQYGGGDRGFPMKCDCGLRVVPLLSKTQENPGRPFYRCISKKEGHLFKWNEDAVCEEVEDAIPKLEIIDRVIT
uniref:GRF-type domain-containing protein n=1 Tax=Brassica oleracea var. oleracea TaxID=109376 RepID=A0A0D3ASQ7_BRAOL